MSAPNPVNGLVTFLKADTAVAARVAARVYGPDGVPTSQNSSMPRAAIVVSPAGGLGVIGNAYQPHSDRRVDILCYGSSQFDSYELYLDVHAALKNLRRSYLSESADQDVVIHWAKVAADGVTSRDPVTGWPATLSSWTVLASEAPVSV